MAARFAEPDPRVDLSGKDVMRKLVILAREAGYDIEPGAVRMESLVPAGCEEGSVDHFFGNGDELNDQMVQRLEAAREMGLVLRYVWRVLRQTAKRVGVEAVVQNTRWPHFCRVITSLRLKAVGTVITRW